jgi:hypothetical protein
LFIGGYCPLPSMGAEAGPAGLAGSVWEAARTGVTEAVVPPPPRFIGVRVLTWVPATPRFYESGQVIPRLVAQFPLGPIHWEQQPPRTESTRSMPRSRASSPGHAAHQAGADAVVPRPVRPRAPQRLPQGNDSARAGRLTRRRAAWVKERICCLVVEGPKERLSPGRYAPSRIRAIEPPSRSTPMRSISANVAPGLESARRMPLPMDDRSSRARELDRRRVASCGALPFHRT